MLSNEGRMGLDYICNECGTKRFYTRDARDEHQRSCISGQKFRCKACNYGTSLLKNFKRHLNSGLHFKRAHSVPQSGDIIQYPVTTTPGAMISLPQPTSAAWMSIPMSQPHRREPAKSSVTHSIDRTVQSGKLGEKPPFEIKSEPTDEVPVSQLNVNAGKRQADDVPVGVISPKRFEIDTGVSIPPNQILEEIRRLGELWRNVSLPVCRSTEQDILTAMNTPLASEDFNTAVESKIALPPDLVKALQSQSTTCTVQEGEDECIPSSQIQPMSPVSLTHTSNAGEKEMNKLLDFKEELFEDDNGEDTNVGVKVDKDIKEQNGIASITTSTNGKATANLSSQKGDDSGAQPYPDPLVDANVTASTSGVCVDLTGSNKQVPPRETHRWTRGYVDRYTEYREVDANGRESFVIEVHRTIDAQDRWTLYPPTDGVTVLLRREVRNHPSEMGPFL